MRTPIAILLSLALVVIASCSGKVATTAIIRVTHGDPPQPSSGAESVEAEEEVLTSHLFGQHVDEKLGLSKLWGISDEGVVARLGKAITVKPGNEPGLFVVVCDGLEHDVAVKVVNELCAFAKETQIEASGNNGKPQPVHVSIIQPAK